MPLLCLAGPTGVTLTNYISKDSLPVAPAVTREQQECEKLEWSYAPVASPGNISTVEMDRASFIQLLPGRACLSHLTGQPCRLNSGTSLPVTQGRKPPVALTSDFPVGPQSSITKISKGKHRKPCYGYICIERQEQIQNHFFG